MQEAPQVFSDFDALDNNKGCDSRLLLQNLQLRWWIWKAFDEKYVLVHPCGDFVNMRRFKWRCCNFQQSQERKNQADVKVISFEEQMNVSRIRRNLGRFFPSTEWLMITSNEILDISSHDLEQFPKFRFLNLAYNNLTIL